MIILAIDTSCDDTSVALIKATKSRIEIKSNVVSSQVKIHQKYGGVFPFLAKREHERNLTFVLKKALSKAKLLYSRSKPNNSKFQIKIQELKKILKREEFLYQELKRFLEEYQKPNIDAIAVTIGPGLEPCLWVGVNFAKALCFFWNIPVIPVNHIEAHIAANFIKTKIEDIIFPAVCLVVSGGHTQLILMKDIGKYKVIGETRDDAAGECFDKTARILGLSYPGGPLISAEAAKESEKKVSISLPRPMINTKDYDFSFSGLKTAVLYDFKKRNKETRGSLAYIRAMAREIQQSIIDVLIKKTIRAAQDFKAKTIMLGGGVACNRELKKQFRQKTRKLFIFQVPVCKLCTDNAAMIGAAAWFNKEKARRDFKKIRVNANLKL